MTTPQVEKATLYVRKAAHNNWQLVLAWTQTASQEILRPRRFVQEQLFSIMEKSSNLADSEAKVVSILLSMVSLVRDDSLDFQDQCLSRIGELRYLRRKRLSQHKMNFILHLDDHRQEAQRGIREAQEMLRQITEYLSRIAGLGKVPSPLNEQATMLAQQLKGLDKDLDKS